MSRSGYSDDCENIELYRRAVDNAIRGKRGQSFLREMAAALDTMPTKELIAEELVRPDGQACAIGAVALARGIDVVDLDAHDGRIVGEIFGIASSLAAEIAYMNDEWPHNETPAQRWTRMREWVEENLVPPSPEVIAKRLRRFSQL